VTFEEPMAPVEAGTNLDTHNSPCARQILMMTG
jgi:hypothetical protein